MQVLSELIRKLMLEEKAVLNNNPVKHPTLIGDMYEGLTKELLQKIDMSHPAIKVVSGIIRSGESQSGQIDCMIVIGDGEVIPKTDNYFYPIDQVIAVFEVKKNLFSKEINDAYQHLNDVFQLSKKDYQAKQDAGILNFNTIRPAQEFLNLFGHWPPHYEENYTLPWEQRVVYQSLVRDWLTPLRIAIGYNGFKSEDTLRSSIFKIYKNKEYENGYGVQNMPNLMISDGYSLIKMNGMPYKGIWKDQYGWCWLGSSNANPILLIMELLFDRIQLILGINPDRGEDLHDEIIYPLAVSKPVRQSGVNGWCTDIISEKIPKRDAAQMQWCPLLLSTQEKEFLRLLYKYGPQHIKGKNIREYQILHRVDNIFEVTESLRNARVILINNEQFYICSGQWSLAKVCGNFYCGDNAGGRFENWVRLKTIPPWRIGDILRISPLDYGPY
ncbi:DUF6602 domain-containing protein [Providencia alcalifaciens]|uniref:DUF6602 domain-containing protein n=1 Tax=Providencia alcalifaciens TaxID=126385 RepID=UPI00029BC642|nr:DUF6602 domain-containing protein [Providencia alcalifaciens]EKT66685.1 hypothetical protein OO9_04800 [Providencia alcalifaciens Dmel2]